MLEVKNCPKVIKENFNKPLIITESEEEDFKRATHCHICQSKYKEDDVPVRDHRHITGNFEALLRTVQFKITNIGGKDQNTCYLS